MIRAVPSPPRTRKTLAAEKSRMNPASGPASICSAPTVQVPFRVTRSSPPCPNGGSLVYSAGRVAGDRVGVGACPAVAEVGLRGLGLVGDGGPGGSGRSAHGRALLGQQRADQLLGLVVGALPVVHLADRAQAIDQVVGRPVALVVGPPGGEVVVDRDGVLDAEVGRPLGDVVDLAFECELRGVDPDDGQALVAVGLVPRGDVGQRPLAVDAGVGPEVDQDRTPSASSPARVNG